MVHFFTIEVDIFFLNPREILHLLIPMKFILQKNVGPLGIVDDPKSCNQRWSGHWVKIFVVAIIGIFKKICNKSQGIFLLKIRKKSKVNPPC
jgi:hypothetical protein